MGYAQKVWNVLAEEIIQHATRTPYWHLTGYMERFWFLRLGKSPVAADESPRPGEDRRKGRFGAIRVHHILRSDQGRDWHDHPWWFLTIILRGGYYETRPVMRAGRVIGEKRKWHGPGSVLVRRASTWHRLELPDGRDAWTLFVTGRIGQTWGFLTDAGKVPHQRYFQQHPEAAP